MFPYMDPPISLVRSHYVPTAQEHSTIETLVSSSGFAISALESAISDLQSTTSLLQFRLMHYGAYREFHGALLSPIRKLPNELLGHIFAYVCNDTVDIVTTNTDSIWDLQRVCMRWRDVLKHIQSLWCNFRIEYVSCGKIPGHAAITRRILSCLENSGSQPLTITLKPETYSAFPIPVFADIGIHSDRWESLSIDATLLTYAMEQTEFKAIIQRYGMSRLRSLILDETSRSPYPFHVFKGATNLQGIDLSFCTLPGVNEFPWSNVKKLVLSNCDIDSEDKLSSILCAMTSLEALVWISNYLYIEPSKTIMLPSLRTLSVENHGHEDFDEEDGLIPRKLPMLCTPHLSELWIVGDINQLQGVVSIVRHPESSIKCIIVESNSASFALQAIKELPNIEELILPSAGEHRNFLLKNLIRNPDSNSEGVHLLPLLRKIVLRSANLKDSTISLLMKVMRSRSIASSAPGTQDQIMPSAPLSQVVCTRYRNKTSLGQLEDLGKELGIEVKSGPQSEVSSSCMQLHLNH
ncbi:hypothetical protein BDQ17DRAFT_1368602 [Cyathus striatus]|nr:hypothetical protein BDQ17DRAFT_1368602 [Cyathus striatus]